MDNKKICCIADTDIKSKVMVLLEEIQWRINLTIPLLSDNDSVVEYEVVIFVLSNGARNNPSIQTLLKEASDLNKIFLPSIIGNGLIKNWLLKRKFAKNNFHSPYYYLNNVKDMLLFYTQLMSFSGSTVVGDPFGRVYTFYADTDCQIIRNQDVIAEISAGQSIDVTLYLGKHRLKITTTALDLTKELDLSVNDIENSEKITIDTKFIPEVTITSSIDMSIIEGKQFLAAIRENEATIIKLLPGTHKLKFQHPIHKNLNRYITVRIKVDEDIGIVYNFPYSPKVCSFC